MSVVLSVVSEGEAADDLRRLAAERPDLPMVIHPFQPAELLSDTLGSADVLVGLLEPEATTFSIPSKVLTYMAAGRPIVGLMPTDNPAAADIAACGGFVDEPTSAGAQRAAAWLSEQASDPASRDRDREANPQRGRGEVRSGSHHQRVRRRHRRAGGGPRR